jgi:hypothetical protein
MPCAIRAAEDATDGHGWVVVDTRSRTRVRNDKHGVYTDEFVAMTNDSFVLGIDGVVFNSEIIAGIPPDMVSKTVWYPSAWYPARHVIDGRCMFAMFAMLQRWQPRHAREALHIARCML